MVLLATKMDPTPSNANNGGDYPNFVAFLLEVRPLFNMAFEVPHIALWVQPCRGKVHKCGRLDGISQPLTLGIGGSGNRLLGQHSTKGAASQTPQVGAFF